MLTAVRVGKTQSNMSTQTTRSVANPTPMQYRGLFLGRSRVESSTTLQKVSLASPPLQEKY